MTVNVFYDFEFFEDGIVVDPISIGMVVVPERGKPIEYYAVNEEFNTQRMLAHPNCNWLLRNVFSSIQHERITDGGCSGMVDLVITDPNAMPKAQIAQDIYDLLLPQSSKNIELWAYYAAYDHVALAQLWGRMLEMPSDVVPMYTNDIMTLSSLNGHPEIPKQAAGQHNALSDARHNYEVWKFLKSL